ncbi:DUF1573 domain-containing protein [Persicitalea jodogahamensis]|uniref:DUF1573 domain-containing protein n=1 Tax=Persicitalea jodogahamensis TaxID=402147 RepID=A0A8J3D8R6_9BACT|nr:DUF1573 domain-containing protein [Persicitalea jodogahamensis]GHB77073.1 hypothetical protein GCM10007390_33870 [Persicitalea jodogahamensis]
MKSNSIFTLFFSLFVMALLAGCGAKSNEAEEGRDDLKSKIPVITMLSDSTYQFGDITEGDVVEHEFKFKNDGQFPLIINNVTASCGCTIPEWPREPIAPGAESSIQVRFNSKGKPGPQVKTITVFANTEPAYSELRIQGMVAEAPDSTSSI